VQKLKDIQERVRLVEQNSLFIRHENAKVKEQKDQLYIALKMTHSNCDELLKITGKQNTTTAEQLGKTLINNLQQSNKNDLISNASTLKQVTSILNSVTDK
jgi:hypothetical protein